MIKSNTAAGEVAEIEDGTRVHDDTEVEDDDGDFVMTQLEGLWCQRFKNEKVGISGEYATTALEEMEIAELEYLLEEYASHSKQ